MSDLGGYLGGLSIKQKTPQNWSEEAPSVGIEPTTVGLEVRCSVH